ncbi:Serine carboxypeptidase-like [Hibiscus syriacus]|uniref:Serine carboxypeptidase-like n=1 Tax=Hibiscus syriacus TaxID=106335 RepID=A0A6A3AR01_HIBSY|nr:Serine carboxypeptidase-like [Hibiscus syriacus]
MVMKGQFKGANPSLTVTDSRARHISGKTQISKKDPVVIWFTGGPGCSSELAVFYENGPFTIADNIFCWSSPPRKQSQGGNSYKPKGALLVDWMRKFVRDSLGVGNVDFVSCSPTVYQAMLVDWMRNLEAGIPALIEDGIKLLVYAGEDDLICNWLD